MTIFIRAPCRTRCSAESTVFRMHRLHFFPRVRRLESDGHHLTCRRRFERHSRGRQELQCKEFENNTEGKRSQALQTTMQMISTTCSLVYA